MYCYNQHVIKIPLNVTVHNNYIGWPEILADDFLTSRSQQKVIVRCKDYIMCIQQSPATHSLNNTGTSDGSLWGEKVQATLWQ